MNNRISEILSRLKAGDVVPYLGPDALRDVVSPVTGAAVPADSDSLILAMNGGKPMAPRLMYEFSRAAMNLENKKGRSFIERFLTQTYGGDGWTPSALHRWIADLNLPYVIDINRDTLMQQCYADREHILIVGCARLIGTYYRFEIYHGKDGQYQRIDQEQVDPDLPVLFKPLGTPIPKPAFIASDADFVDYITELMGGFAIPGWIKQKRKNLQYLFLGMRFNRDTERMIMSDIIYDAAPEAGWALITDPTAKELKTCSKKHLDLVEADWSELLSAANA